MTVKFTEKQYFDMVNIVDNAETVSKGIQDVLLYIRRSTVKTARVSPILEFRALALANPATRRLVHDLYVEDEQKYYWTTKKKADSGSPLNLFHGAGGVVQMMGPIEMLTRTEVVEWGFNPDDYNFTSDKEEALAYIRGEK